MIELIPAIDIIGGQCVRLTKGDYDQKTVYRDSPAEVAKEFEDLGFKRLHVVDLDGAKSKHIVNDAVLKSITTETNLIVDFGGGIKTDEDIEKAFASGASMVTVGSIAVTHPELFMGWLEKYGAERMILGADVRHGKISIKQGLVLPYPSEGGDGDVVGNNHHFARDHHRHQEDGKHRFAALETKTGKGEGGQDGGDQGT